MSEKSISPVQTVAQAMLDSDIEQGHASPDSPQWARYEVLARTAIEAMRVPTNAMEAAGDALDDWGVPSDPGTGNASALAHWHAMIDEALK